MGRVFPFWRDPYKPLTRSFFEEFLRTASSAQRGWNLVALAFKLLGSSA
jgi:hypothetical protein